MQQYKRRTLLTLCGVALLLLGGLLLSTRGFIPQHAFAQTDVEPGITAPAAGTSVTETVTVRGTATHPAFLRYELYYKVSAAGEDAYIYFDGGTEEVVDSELGVWDTAELQPGSYDLRLRVVRNDGNYSEYVVPGIQVGQPTLEPTATVAVTTTELVTPTAEAPTTESVEPTVAVTATTAPSPTTTTTTTEPTTLPADAAQIVTDRNLNVRGGPSTDYPVVSTLSSGERALITGQNATGDWWQIAIEASADGTGWVLGRLVTAENVGDVPVVAVAAPPVTETVTLTPVVTPTATPAIVQPTATAPAEADESAAETATADEGSAQTGTGATTAVAVNFVGNADNAENLATLLRMVLLSFSSSDSMVTATVGTLPGNLPVALTVPTTATVVGGVERTGDFASHQIFLTTDGTGDALLSTLRNQLTSQGFAAPTSTAQGGSTQVFLSNAPSATATLLCNQEAAVAVNLGMAALADEGATVTLLITPVSRFSDPCSSDTAGAESALFNVLPQLAPPPQAQVQGSGGGSSSGPDNVSLSAEAMIEATQTVAELADHYEQQLAAAGWEQVAQSRTNSLTWSSWSFVDESGDSWSVIFYIVEGSDSGTYIATLRAESQF